jgi:hypothetical protein
MDEDMKLLGKGTIARRVLDFLLSNESIHLRDFWRSGLERQDQIRGAIHQLRDGFQHFHTTVWSERRAVPRLCPTLWPETSECAFISSHPSTKSKGDKQ